MSEQSHWKNLRWLLLSLLIILLDQMTKQLALNYLPAYHPVEMLSFFNFTLSFNKGAAFSFLSNSGVWAQWFLTTVAIVISAVIIVWLYRLPKDEKLTAIMLSLILGGALGNLIDRFIYGAVIDFLDFHYQYYHWPAFNIADSAICIGTIGLILTLFFSGEKKKPEN